MLNIINWSLKFFKLKLIQTNKPEVPIDILEEEMFMDLYSNCKQYTMTSIERLYSAYKSVEYIVKNDIEGDIIECGVWKGGSMMMMAYKLLQANKRNKNLYLYDTFEGMSQPTEKDIDNKGNKGFKTWDKNKTKDKNLWCYASQEEVSANLAKTSYPQDKIFFIKGKVEDTIPSTLPKRIAILRLDTDWYESTKHELEHLFPLVVEGGVIIIDDYGYWKGAKDAVDEYLKINGINVFLNRVDYTCRLGIKQTNKKWE